MYNRVNQGGQGLDYGLLVEGLPERLLQVKEDDIVYLSEFLEIYEQLLGMLSEKQGEGSLSPVSVTISSRGFSSPLPFPKKL